MHRTSQHSPMHQSAPRHRLTGLLGAATIFVAACGSSGSPAASGETPNPNAAFGGTATIATWENPTSFLDANITASETVGVASEAPALEGLLWFRSTNQTSSAKSLADYWAPWLATQVPTTDNGLVKTTGCTHTDAKLCVTWPLRSDVTWHDGSRFTSHDVCDTFQFWFIKYKGNGPTALQSTSGWDQVIACDETDPQTAVVSFKSTYGPYLQLGSGVSGVLPASVLDPTLAKNVDLAKFVTDLDLTKGSKNPAAFIGKSSLDLAADGTGPFVLQSYEQGKQIVYVRNMNYWNKQHLPHLDKIVIKFESDLAAQLTDVKTGAVDMSWDNRLYSLQTLQQATSLGKVQVQAIPESGVEKLDFNLCATANGACGPGARINPYTADPIIRRAILKGLDRKGIVHNQAADKTQVPKDSWMYVGVEWVDDPSIPSTGYDLAAANKLLDDAGYKLDAKCSGGKFRSYKDGSCIKINIGTTSNNPSRVAIEGLVADNLAQIGIEVPKPFADNKPNGGSFFAGFADHGPIYNHQFDMALYTVTVSAPAEPDSYYAAYHGTCGGSCGGNDPHNQIPSAANNGNGQNGTGENNPLVDKALDSARGSVDLSQRAKYYVQAEKLLAQDLPEIPLFQQIVINTYNTQIQGLLPNDIVWTYNSYDWYCTAGKCQA